jgi:hypothetical protein
MAATIGRDDIAIPGIFCQNSIQANDYPNAIAYLEVFNMACMGFESVPAMKYGINYFYNTFLE